MWFVYPSFLRRFLQRQPLGPTSRKPQLHLRKVGRSSVARLRVEPQLLTTGNGNRLDAPWMFHLSGDHRTRTYALCASYSPVIVIVMGINSTSDLFRGNAVFVHSLFTVLCPPVRTSTIDVVLLLAFAAFSVASISESLPVLIYFRFG